MKRKLLRRLLSGILCVLLLGAYVPAASAESEDILFSDDFSAPNNSWTVVDGQMTVKDGVARLDATTGSQTEHEYAWVDGVGTDVVVTVKFKPLALVSGKEERIGIIAHSKGGGEGDIKWCAILDGGYLNLLAEGLAWLGSVPFSYSEGNTYVMKTMARKDKLYAKVWQDGTAEPADWMLENTFPWQLEEDGVGLYYANSVVEFDDFVVQSSPEMPPDITFGSLKPGNVFVDGEKPVVDVKLDNTQNKSFAGQFTVDYVVTDYMGNKVESDSRLLEVSPGKVSSFQIKLNKSSRKGKYDIECTMSANGEVIDTNSTSVILIDRITEGNIKESPFGIGSYGGFLGIRYDERKLADTYTMMEKLGVKWTREEIHWSDMRPEKDGPYTWEKFDQTVVEARNHKINIMGIIDYWASWSLPYTEGANTDWETAIANIKQYAIDVVQRYAPGGDLAREKGWTDGYGISNWEIWNEPPTFWFGTAEQFAWVVAAVSEGIKSVDPDAFIICSNSGETFDKTVLDMVGQDAYNALAIHLYPGAVSPEAGEYQKSIRETRSFLDKNGAADKEIWMTETGWNTIGQVTQMQQANYIVRSNILSIAAGLDKLFTFTFNYNNSSEGWGVVDENLTPKISFAAYAAMAARLEGKSVTDEINMGSDVKAIVFKDSSTVTVPIWVTAGTGTLTLKPDKHTTYYIYDMMGNQLGKYINQKFSIPLSESPVYLETTEASPDQVAGMVRSGDISDMDPVKITVGELSEFPAEGRTPTMNITVTNRINVVQNGTLSVESPEGWQFGNTRAEFTGLQPGETRSFTFELASFQSSDSGKYPVKVVVTTEKGTVEFTSVKYVFATKKFTPIIDGDFSDWSSMLKVSIDTPDKVFGKVGWTPENLSAVAATSWDDNYFYLGVEVTDDVHTQGDPGWWLWNDDSIQFFFDLNNDKDGAQQEDDRQFGAAITNDGRIGFMDYVSHVTTYNIDGKIVRDEVNRKTIYEIRVPWSELNVTPYAGMKIGFNFMANDGDNGPRDGWIVWKEGIGNSYSPEKWSTWELIN